MKKQSYILATFLTALCALPAAANADPYGWHDHYRHHRHPHVELIAVPPPPPVYYLPPPRPVFVTPYYVQQPVMVQPASPMGFFLQSGLR